MSAAGQLADLLTLPRGEEQVKPDEYLSDVSPRHKPWDVHRAEADEVQQAYASGASRHQRYAERVEHCSQVLEFARDLPPVAGTQKPQASGKTKLKLKNAWFCRVRHCPVCQWRRSLMWQAKVYRALPQLLRDYPDTRFLFLTLTVRNCEVKDLRATLLLMATAWKRLIQSRSWPARGWVRAVEITRSRRDRTAHPHYHCLLMVPPAYFQGDYLKQKEWAELWRQCLRINYRPVVDIRTVKLDLVQSTQRVNKPPARMWEAVAEILKYAVKPSDMIRDHDWLLTLTDQVHKVRGVAIGGILKRYIKEREPDDLVTEPGEEEPAKEDLKSLYFGWKQPVQRYRKLNLDKGLVLVSGQSRT
jgi:plasmid rolling circle replication initiator protein Rep